MLYIPTDIESLNEQVGLTPPELRGCSIAEQNRIANRLLDVGDINDPDHSKSGCVKVIDPAMIPKEPNPCNCHTHQQKAEYPTEYRMPFTNNMGNINPYKAALALILIILFIKMIIK